MSSRHNEVKRTSERSPESRGTLFVCGGPVGNLEDLTARVTRLLRECDLVAAERPSHTRRLLEHVGTSASKLRACAESTPVGELDRVVDAIRGGATVVLVSDAGTPAISDPGWRLVARAVEAGCDVRAAPGPSSLVAAASISGFACDELRFLGFPSRKRGERLGALNEALEAGGPFALFESPERIAATMRDLAEAAPDRAVCLVREMTKMYEEALRGSASEVVEALPERPRGELTLVVGPASDREREEREDRRDRELERRIRELADDGLAPRALVRALVVLAGVSRNHAMRLVRAAGLLEEGPDE